MNVTERWQRPILLFSVLLVASFTLWVIPGNFSPAQQGSGLLLSVLLRSAAALFLMQIVLGEKEPRQKAAWRLLTVAMALFALSDAYLAMAFAPQAALPVTPSGADLIRMGGLLAALAMAASYPLDVPEHFGRIREFLDIAILLLTASTLAFLILIWPVFEIGLGDADIIFWLSIAPLAELSLMLLVLRIVLRINSRRGRWTFRLLGLAIFAYFISDLGAGYEVIQVGSLNPGLRYAAVLAGSVLVMIAAYRWRSLESSGYRIPRIERWRARIAPRLEPLLPIAATYVVVGYILFDWWYTKQVNWGAVFMAALLSVLLVARQGVVVGQFEMRQFAALVQSSADASFVCRMDGNIRLSNPALLSLLGVNEADAADLNLESVLDESITIGEMLASAAQQGWVGETHMRGAAGPILVSLSLMPVRDRSGQTQLLAGTAHDLTMVREREDALRAALGELATAHADLETLNQDLEKKITERTSALQATVGELQKLNIKLQSLDRMKSEFVALVSHELRAPLTNIRSGIELIMETTPELDARVEERLRVVEGETVRLSGFVEAILDLSALDAGRFPIQLYPVPLESILDRVIGRMPELAVAERVSIHVPDDLPAVCADERALESVLFHIFDNAMKYAPESVIEIEGWAEEGNVYAAIVDHGVGIPPEMRERAFDMFQRLDPSDTREIYGHGLGLYMARRFLTAMQGGIRAEDPGHPGTRIVFWLPEAVE